MRRLNRGSRPALHVVVGNQNGRAAMAPGLGAWLARIAPSSAKGLVNVSLVSDATVRELNRRHRGLDQSTDVLSFPARWDARTRRSQSGAPRRFGNGLLTSAPFLGDIVIAQGVSQRQARAAGHSQGTELRVLALHGLLHLLGYDHERDGGRMLRLERRLRREGGLREGLIERAT